METDGTYVLAPNEHIDTYFYISQDQFQRDVWYVTGVREEDMDEISLRFVSDEHGKWVQTYWYV